jgi:predicted protein tyrosine phosphatase
VTGIFVCPWAEVEDSVEDTGATHVVSLLGVEGVPDTPNGVEPENHLYLEMDDISGSIGGYISPGIGHIQELLDFVSGWDQRGPILTHCYAGISRSTAAALIIAVHLNPGREAAAAALLRRRAPHAQPNRRMIELADRAMDCRGRLIAAHAEMGPRVDRGIYGRLFGLPLRFG